MAAQNPPAPGRDASDRDPSRRDPGPEVALRELIAALRSPGAVNAGFAAALIALLETTLEHELRVEEGSTRPEEEEHGPDDE
ncbi:hypothetical protein HQQ81_12780 [Microbacteriaceae bacterium VKM Ac-2854]|nr:hypothetical protein [Microbacteriaceae bacterium VKM Ac-2854]